MKPRSLVLCIAVSISWASLAVAQVATPTLNPLEGGVTGNPATLPYAPSSFVGGAYGRGTVKTVDAIDKKIATGDVQSRQLHLRLVGERFAAALDVLDSTFSADQEPGAVFSYDNRERVQRAALSARIVDDFTFGLGAEVTKQDADNLVGTPPLGGGTLNVSEVRNSTLPLAGAVLRFGSVMYLGAAFGQERLHVEQTGYLPASDSLTFDVKRDVLRYALGLLMMEKTDGDAVRIEVAAETRDPYYQPGLFGGPDTPSKDEREATRGAIDVLLAPVLLSASVRHDDVFDDGNKIQKQDETSVSLGWVPKAGWAITLSDLRTRVEFVSAFNGRHEFDVKAVGLHRQF